VSAGAASPERVYLALCFTLDRFGTAADVEALVRHFFPIAARRRALAPLGRR